LTKVPKP
jgi:hypothetical protein